MTAAELIRKIRAEAAAEFEQRQAEADQQLDAWLAASIGAIVDAACAPLRVELAEVTQQRDEALDRLEDARYKAMGEDL